MPSPMSDEPRVLSMENLPDAIRIMNESSRGMSFEWHLDLFGFLALARYWNISAQHTLLGYEDGQPAALIITATDPETREAYIVYWAALPQFRKGRTAIRLFESCCQKLYDDGYEILYGASVPDRPVRRYRFIKSDVEYAILDLQAESTNLPESQSRFEVREIDLETISNGCSPTRRTSSLVPTKFVSAKREHVFPDSSAPLRAKPFRLIQFPSAKQRPR